jgi:hypothetical protein
MFEKIGVSSGNLKTEKILLNERGHLKVINTMTYPDDNMNTMDQMEITNSTIQRFYGNYYLIKPHRS